MISERTKTISESATLKIDAKAREMKSKGIDVISFGAGQPDFPTPMNVKNAAKRAIDDNFTGYTDSSGIPELRQAIADKFKRDNNITYSKDQVLVSCGGKHSLFNAFEALVNLGDEVIIPNPYWVSYPEMVKICEGIPVFSNFELSITAKEIENKINEKTKLIVINSPNNPSGAVIQESELRKIADLAVKHNLIVFSDEVYEPFVFEGKHFSIASFNDKIKELTLTFNAVSKTYSMTGWRIGYCAGPKDVIKAMANLQSHSTSNPASISQKAALEALNGPQESVKEMVREFDKRRKFMYNKLNEIGLKCPKPEGAFYCFPDIFSTNLTSMEFTEKLLEEAKVAVVPGVAFGSDNHIRLSYATSMKNIENGLLRIEEWLAALNQ